MELNFAAGGRSQSGRGKAGDLPQEFFQGFFVFGSDGCNGGSVCGGSGSPRNFWARRVPEAAGRRKVISPRTAPPTTTVYQISDSVTGQGLGRDFESIALRRGFARDLGEHILETGFPGIAPLAKFGAEFGRRSFAAAVVRRRVSASFQRHRARNIGS